MTCTCRNSRPTLSLSLSLSLSLEKLYDLYHIRVFPDFAVTMYISRLEFSQRNSFIIYHSCFWYISFLFLIYVILVFGIYHSCFWYISSCLNIQLRSVFFPSQTKQQGIVNLSCHHPSVVVCLSLVDST